MSPKIEKVYSENNVFQRADVLKRNRNKRSRYSEFLVEGVKCVNAALEHGWKCRSVFFCGEKGLSDWGRQVLQDSGAEIAYDLTLALLEKLSEKEETSEILLSVEMPSDDLTRIPVSEDFFLVVLDRPNSPGNLGSSIRSCDALGASGVIVTGHAADVYHPQAVRGSMGALFSIPVVRLDSSSELEVWLDTLKPNLPDLQIVGTSASGEVALREYSFSGATVLVVGNESVGLSANYRAECDTILCIPQVGHTSSLNVSSALSIVLYEAACQRARPPLRSQ